MQPCHLRWWVTKESRPTRSRNPRSISWCVEPVSRRPWLAKQLVEIKGPDADATHTDCQITTTEEVALPSHDTTRGEHQSFLPAKRFYREIVLPCEEELCSLRQVCIDPPPQLAESWQGRNPHPSDEVPALDPPVFDLHRSVVGTTAWRLESARWKSTKVVLTLRHLHDHGVDWQVFHCKPCWWTVRITPIFPDLLASNGRKHLQDPHVHQLLVRQVRARVLQGVDVLKSSIKVSRPSNCLRRGVDVNLIQPTIPILLVQLERVIEDAACHEATRIVDAPVRCDPRLALAQLFGGLGAVSHLEVLTALHIATMILIELRELVVHPDRGLHVLCHIQSYLSIFVGVFLC
mmetsp:Transcript_37833/g.100697  ORF Transcript_37833/g.100697 Transcript_37833/m.100697 type:complete len:348 (-) Transcript_37833:208-1251(-)